MLALQCACSTKKSGDDLAIHGGPVTRNLAVTGRIMPLESAKYTPQYSSYIPQLNLKMVVLPIINLYVV